MATSLTSKVGTSEADAVTPAQVADVVRVAEAAARSAAEEVTGQLVASGTMTRAAFQQVVESRDKIKRAVASTLGKLIPELARLRLRCISPGEKLTLKPTDGKRTIAKAKTTFDHIDVDFKNYGTDVSGQARTGMVPVVHELLEDSTFEQMFNSLSANLDSLCFEQDQIIDFVTDHRNWLRTDGYATLFLFKVADNFFVADVCLGSDGELGVFVRYFSCDYVWDGEYRVRVVVPQLNQ
jgi:hypothetical protein